MSHRMKALGAVLSLAAVAAVVVPLIARPRDEGDKPTTSGGAAAQPDQARPDADRKDDRAAISKSLGAFVQAMEKGDAKAVAACWTTQGEYVTDDGTTLRGREAIQKAYKAFFDANKSLRAKVEVDSLRFVAKDTAVEEGHFTLTRGQEVTTSRYSALHVREGGRWLLALVRDWPAGASSARVLGWLVGTWASKRDGREVTTTYAWDEAKAFLIGRYTIKDRGKTTTGTQVIGKSPETGELHSWTFDGDGGVGQGVWLREGKTWVIESQGTLPDGSTLTARNILTPVDADSFTWQVTGRTENDEELPNLPPVKVVRVKTSKGR